MQAVALQLDHSSWINRFNTTRERTLRLCEPLCPDDMNLQAAVFASPPKWHLAHTSWFFETFLLKPYLSGYEAYDPSFDLVFNSYYEGIGPVPIRHHRGLLSRPTLAEVMAYRLHVDAAMLRLLTMRGGEPDITATLWVGLQHEEQHQELLLTDLKYAFSFNPLRPVYLQESKSETPKSGAPSPAWLPLREGVHDIGQTLCAAGFDNEKPVHRVFLRDAFIASRPVTNGEYLAFIADGGYQLASLWLAPGWEWLRRKQVGAPLYWEEEDGAWFEYTLRGKRLVNANAPVTHVSYFEADAFARWAGARLPNEAEWELAAKDEPVAGNFLESGYLHPMPASEKATQFFGDTWEWTTSAYAPYPGFRPYTGVLGEYNGKFMCGQFVLRGGSCVSPQEHLRLSYRNFFPPESRWQFSGIRLAKDEL